MKTATSTTRHRIRSSCDFIQWILLTLLLLLCPLSRWLWSMCISYSDTLWVRLVTLSSGSPTANHFPTNLPSDLHRKCVYTALELPSLISALWCKSLQTLNLSPRIWRQSVTNTDFWKLQRNVAEKSVGRKWVTASIEIKIKPSPESVFVSKKTVHSWEAAPVKCFLAGGDTCCGDIPPA